MRSPFRPAEDLDDPLAYAPPLVRDCVQTAPMETCAPADWQTRSRLLADTDAFSGDRSVLEVQRQLALEPESVPEPPPSFVDRRTVGRVALRTCGASGAAALIAWMLVSAPGVRLLERVLGQLKVEGQEVVALAPALATFVEQPEQNRVRVATARAAERPDEQSGADREARESGGRTVLAVPSIVAVAAAAEPAPQVTAPAVAPPARPISQPATAPALVIRQLDSEEINSLVARGEALIASGDLASARLALQRAAEGGNARAALTLAGTFDPKLSPGHGLATDAAMARLWYERAKQLGSTEAPLRLQQLAAQVDALH